MGAVRCGVTVDVCFMVDASVLALRPEVSGLTNVTSDRTNEHCMIFLNVRTRNQRDDIQVHKSPKAEHLLIRRNI